MKRTLFLLALLIGASARADGQYLLAPMDETQRNHLKAYGLAFQSLKDGSKVEWLLNFRGGSFLMSDTPDLRRLAALGGISLESANDNEVAAIKSEIAASNMDIVVLEKAPRIAIYTPPLAPPWDDAVTLALEYAGIPYTKVWDEEVLRGDLTSFDWLHLHHEDFTGQLNKFHISFSGTDWYRQQRRRNADIAARLGFGNTPALKKAVSESIRRYVEGGGFLFAMCGATETLELAIAGQDVDIAEAFTDGTPIEPDVDTKLNWTRSFAFTGVHVERDPTVSAMSDIDGHQVNVLPRRQPLGAVSLFAFSPKFDPVASMLVQDHRSLIGDFYGVTTSFTRRTLKPGVTVLAYEEGAPWVKYIHGDYGRGSWTFLGGHDPEDAQHSIGSPPTDLSLHPNSPGYRLILNNVLFPAAKKKPLKT